MHSTIDYMWNYHHNWLNWLLLTIPLTCHYWPYCCKFRMLAREKENWLSWVNKCPYWFIGPRFVCTVKISLTCLSVYWHGLKLLYFSCVLDDQQLFLPARRYASAGNSDCNVSVCPSVHHTLVLCQNETRKPSYRWQTRATRKPVKNCFNSTCLQHCRWQYWTIFIRLAVVESEICEIRRNSLNIQTYRVQSHPRSSILVSIESPCTTSY